MAGWQRIDLDGRRVDFFEPAASPRFALLFLHDQDAGPPANPTWTNLFEALRLTCVAPHGGQVWWTDRVHPSFDDTRSAVRYLLDSVLPWTRARWSLGPRGVGLFGVGMGGQGALRLAFQRPALFPVVAALTPAIEYHELYWSGTPIDDMYTGKEQCRQDTVPMHLHPTEFPPHIFFAADPMSPWHRGSDRLHEKLAALGVPHECELRTRTGKQGWEYSDSLALRTLTFVTAGLEREARRLL